MFHHHYVGHFDPSDPVDMTIRPFQPEVQRPLLRERVGQLLATFPDNIGEYVCWCEEGYVICNWSFAPLLLSDAVHRFAFEVANREGAVVMSEMFFVEYPPSARKSFEATWMALAGAANESSHSV